MKNFVLLKQIKTKGLSNKGFKSKVTIAYVIATGKFTISLFFISRIKHFTRTLYPGSYSHGSYLNLTAVLFTYSAS